MQITEAVRLLTEAIQESPEYREFSQHKAEIDADAGIKSLVTEYKRLQTVTQMRMLSGQGADAEEQQRFTQLGSLLFADQRTSAFLLSEMRLQRLMAEVFEKLTAAAGMEMPL